MTFIKKYFTLIFLALFAVAAGILTYASREMLCYGSDGMQMVIIAKKYATGNFAGAINAYWSPLMSWFIALLSLFGLDGILAFKIVRILGAILGLYVFEKLLKNFKVGFSVKVICMLLCAIAFSYYLLQEEPDLWVVTLTITYLYFLLNKKFVVSKKQGILVGVVGATSYFAKAYGFPFFVSNFLLTGLLFLLIYRKQIEKRKVILTNLALGFLSFMLLSGIWVGIISTKYNQLIISSSSIYNNKVLTPKFTGVDEISNTFNLPTFSTLLFEKPHETGALSSWEEPYFTVINEPNPKRLADKESRNYLVKNMVRNAKSFYYDFPLKYNLIALFFIGILSFLVGAKYSKWDKFLVVVLGLTFINYAGGYMLLLVQERYLWVNNMLIFIIMAILLKGIVKGSRFVKLLPAVVISLGLLLVGINSRNYIGHRMNWCFDVCSHSGMFSFIEQTEELSVEGRYVSYGSQRPGETRQFYIWSYKTDMPYYGGASEMYPVSQIKTELKQYDIDYLFHDKKYELPVELENVLQLDYKDPNGFMDIYKVKS